MTAMKSMSDIEVADTLKRYASALFELGRGTPVLSRAPNGSMLAEVLGGIDKLRSRLISAADSAGERLHFLVLALLPEHMETVQLALGRAAELARGGSSVSSRLSLICLDFLSTNDFRFANEQERLRFLAKYEKLTGYKLIIIDPGAGDGGEVVYGIETLERLARANETEDASRSGQTPDAVDRDGRRGARGHHRTSE